MPRHCSDISQGCPLKPSGFSPEPRSGLGLRSSGLAFQHLAHPIPLPVSAGSGISSLAPRDDESWGNSLRGGNSCVQAGKRGSAGGVKLQLGLTARLDGNEDLSSCSEQPSTVSVSALLKHTLLFSEDLPSCCSPCPSQLG